MQQEQEFDLKKHWLSLDKDGREEFAKDAGTTSHYIQTHYTGRRRIPTKCRMEKLFQACRQRGWVESKETLVMFFYAR